MLDLRRPLECCRLFRGFRLRTFHYDQLSLFFRLYALQFLPVRFRHQLRFSAALQLQGCSPLQGFRVTLPPL